MFDGVVNTANRLLGWLRRPSFRGRPALLETPPLPRPYERLQRVLLTEEVSRTLFDEYAAHRASGRGEEEIGWVLLGVREVDHAVVLATLPAGAQRSAGVAHVQFNATAQGLASRIVRQQNKRLMMLGVVHTHPGSLRHPSDGDFQGDSGWVGRLRGGDGVFGIGTADGTTGNGISTGRNPPPHVQTRDALTLSWYGLGVGDRQYRPLPLDVTPGPDLALPLHPLWETIEFFAEPLECLCRQQGGVSFQMMRGQSGPALTVSIKLAEPNTGLRLVLEDKKAAFFWQRGQDLLSVEPPDGQLDRSVYLVLAELTGRS